LSGVTWQVKFPQLFGAPRPLQMSYGSLTTEQLWEPTRLTQYSAGTANGSHVFGIKHSSMSSHVPFTMAYPALHVHVWRVLSMASTVHVDRAESHGPLLAHRSNGSAANEQVKPGAELRHVAFPGQSFILASRHSSTSVQIFPVPPASNKHVL
jgi:hypothetical protein